MSGVGRLGLLSFEKSLYCTYLIHGTKSRELLAGAFDIDVVARSPSSSSLVTHT